MEGTEEYLQAGLTLICSVFHIPSTYLFLIIDMGLLQKQIWFSEDEYQVPWINCYYRAVFKLLVAPEKEDSININPVKYPAISSPSKASDKAIIDKGRIEPEVFSVE